MARQCSGVSSLIATKRASVNDALWHVPSCALSACSAANDLLLISNIELLLLVVRRLLLLLCAAEAVEAMGALCGGRPYVW